VSEWGVLPILIYFHSLLGGITNITLITTVCVWCDGV
jgi:hypothetical protein